MFSIKINGVERKEHITIGSVVLFFNTLGGRNRFNFEYDFGATAPDVYDEVEIEQDGVKIFGGLITNIREQSSRGRFSRIISGTGYEDYLLRISINKVYENNTLREIVEDTIAGNIHGITLGDVDVDLTLESFTIRFNNLYYLLEDLANKYGFLFFVDEEKRIQIYTQERITTTTDYDADVSIIKDSLVERVQENTKINSVVVNGGVGEGEEITEIFEGDGNTNTFTTADFFDFPSVRVGSTDQNVGVAGADIQNYDAIWDSGTLTFRVAPSNNAVIRATGHRKAQILMRVSDTDLIEQNGKIEIILREDAITSFADAERLGRLKIASSQDDLLGGELRTYTRPAIKNVVRVNRHDFALTGFSLQLLSATDGIYTIQYQNKKRATLGLFLRRLYELATANATGNFIEIVDVKETINMQDSVDLDNTSSRDEGINMDEGDIEFRDGGPRYIWARNGRITSSQPSTDAGNYPLVWDRGKWG